MRLPVNLTNVRVKFSKTHKGIDFGFDSKILGKNQPIYATEAGTVIYNRKQTTGGYVIHIKHDNGYVTEYAHLKKNSQLVKEGSKVKKGQQIAQMGASGIATGNHLHFGLYKGTSINYKDKSKFVNPEEYLCMYDDQQYRSNSKIKDFSQTKIVKGVPVTKESNYLNVRDAKGKVVGKVYNGDEVEYYGTKKIKIDGKLTTCACIDNIKGRYISNKYVK
jgi:hypothetical protein